MADFALRAPELPAVSRALDFAAAAPIAVEANAAVALAPRAAVPQPVLSRNGGHCGGTIFEEAETDVQPSLGNLRPLGQVRNSFIVAADGGGLWIIDQHVAHERVLFERTLRQRARGAVETQALLLPLVIELTPAQQAVFAEIAGELARNGFEAEPFGAHTLAIKAAPAGVEAAAVERLLREILDCAGEEQAINLEKLGGEIAASIACHAAIKVNMPLEQNKMEWLLRELAKTECPMTCPHGRPVLLRYTLREIERAFKRI